MARPKKERTVLLDRAAQILDTDGHVDEAAAVRSALAELTRSRSRDDNPNLSVYTFRETWLTAQQAGSIPDLVEEGFAALLAGRFKPKRAQRGDGSGKANFSARARADRRQEVAAYIEAHADTLGWSPSPQQVAAAWLEHRFGPRKRT
ncbi:hypothetical protein [Streptomyces sp. NPDC056683]|uniref:hypothetical protein n=1 Tax=Streptomyces sp. NPDC056683 TaxID=3345910 RepID=UPI003699C6F8